MNAKTIKIVLAVVLLIAAAVLIFKFVSGGPAKGPGGETIKQIPLDVGSGG